MIASQKGAQAAAPRDVAKPVATPLAGLIAGLAIGLVIGWTGHALSNPPSPSAKIASIVPNRVSISTAAKPPVKKATKAEAPQKQEAKPQPHMVPGIPRMVSIDSPLLPLKGSLEPAIPGQIQPITPPKEVKPAGPSLHELESGVRLAVLESGGRISSVRDESSGNGSESKTLVVSAPAEKASNLARRLRGRFGDSATVSNPEADPSSNASSSDPVASSEQKAAEVEATSLKKQLRQALDQFYPDAPAVKSLQSQYAEAVAKVNKFKSDTPQPLVFSVVLTAKSG